MSDIKEGDEYYIFHPKGVTHVHPEKGSRTRPWTVRDAEKYLINKAKEYGRAKYFGTMKDKEGIISKVEQHQVDWLKKELIQSAESLVEAMTYWEDSKVTEAPIEELWGEWEGA